MPQSRGVKQDVTGKYDVKSYLTWDIKRMIEKD